LQQSIIDLGTAFKNYFDSLSGKRKGPKLGRPSFKKKSNRQSIRLAKNGFSIKAGKVFLAKIGAVKTKWSRPLPSDPSSVTLDTDAAGRYFVSFVVEVFPEFEPASREAIGVDLGIKTVAV